MQVDIEKIKSLISIEDILADEGITLKSGRCMCPLHNGKNPTSFSVKNDYFHCIY